MISTVHYAMLFITPLGTLIDPDEKDLDPDLRSPAQSILKVCQGLVLHDKSNEDVRYAHFTIQEYFRDHSNHEDFSILKLAKTCITYLTFNAFEKGPCQNKIDFEARIKKYKAGLYVAQFWGSHTREAEKDREVQHSVLALLQSKNKRNSMLQMEMYNNSRSGDISFTEGQTLLHVIAKNGLATICKLVLHER